jgi:hypothetical protein
MVEIAGECPLLAQSGHHDCADECLLLEIKRTSEECGAMSVFDPKRTSVVRIALCTSPKPHFAVRKSLL